MFCGLFVFQSRICPVLSFQWRMCRSCDLLLPWCLFLNFTLCGLITEFSGSSKQGLYFHRKLQVFAIFQGDLSDFFSSSWQEK